MLRQHSRFALVLIVVLAFLTAVPTGNVAATTAANYIDPNLQAIAATNDHASMIVTATSSAEAAAAVASVGGIVTSDLWLIDAVGADIPTSAIQTLAAQPEVISIVANYGVTSSDWDGWVTDLPLPQTWDGRPDVQPTDDPTVWDIVNPVSIDIGADVLHNTTLPNGDQIRGEGVTVAVIDSGVYFDDYVRSVLGDVVTSQFYGQADFVDEICDTTVNNRGRTRTIGRQRGNYCWLGHHDTADGYGHGTAVASIIWNNFTDANTGVAMGVAPAAGILSVRVLDDNGTGSYETVIEGIQFAVHKRNRFNVRVMNLSISAEANVPYFVDPLNRAVEKAWLKGITVVTAAGNSGPAPSSVTVPGNDPYVITVGAVDQQRTPGYWSDDTMPVWSAAGPTYDGFVKPDIVAPGVNIITFMYKNPLDMSLSQQIVQQHPDNAETDSLFRMNGTSMSTAVASGVATLVIQANPDLTPDQVKYRLMATARPAAAGEETPELVYPVFQQGMGRIWAIDAALEEFPEDAVANAGMNLRKDVRKGYINARHLRFHYQGAVQWAVSDDESAELFYIAMDDGRLLGLGSWDGIEWIDQETIASRRMAWSVGDIPWSEERLEWTGGLILDETVDPSRRMAWSVEYLDSYADLNWDDDTLIAPEDPVDPSRRMAWSVRRMAWSVGMTDWEGGLTWEDAMVDPSRRMAWSVATDPSVLTVTTTNWVDAP
jgi:hypothetical protein